MQTTSYKPPTQINMANNKIYKFERCRNKSTATATRGRRPYGDSLISQAKVHNVFSFNEILHANFNLLMVHNFTHFS